MLEWASPWAFSLLLPVLLLPLQRRWTGVNRLAVGRLDATVTGWTLRRMAWPLPEVLQLAGLVLLVLALARPRLTQHDVLVESEGLDILLAVDTSGSMGTADFKVGIRMTDRLTVAKSVVAEFIENRPHDRIGLVTFGEEAFTQVPLTLDHTSLQSVLDQVQIGMAGAQGTAVGSAIAVSAKRLKDLDAPDRIVILLTDGRSNSGSISPMDAAQAAAALGIKVYTIGIGSSRRTLMNPFGEGLDEAGLRSIAQTTGAAYFGATSADALLQVYDTIDQLEPSPAQVRQLVSHIELYRRFAIPGVLLLLLQVLLRGTWLRRGP
jgi:Ca-activated chloride channel family protein